MALTLEEVTMERARQRLVEALEEEATGGSRSVAAVPASYAERAMNSLMALHTDLMAEKERVIDLTRRLMEERQGRAELEAYVRLLESEVAGLGGPDLREVRDDGAGARRAVDRILARRTSPQTPARAPHATPAALPDAGEAAAPATRAERRPLPRPPRPSRRYRAKVPLSDAAAAPRAARGGAEAAEPATAAGKRTPQDDDWRQW